MIGALLVAGDRYFYVNRKTGTDRGNTITEGRCCLSTTYDPSPYTNPDAKPWWPDPNPNDAFYSVQDGGATVNVYNAAFYEMVV